MSELWQEHQVLPAQPVNSLESQEKSAAVAVDQFLTAASNAMERNAQNVLTDMTYQLLTLYLASREIHHAPHNTVMSPETLLAVNVPMDSETY